MKGEQFPNLANHIANHAPAGTRLFAPREPIYLKDIIGFSPIEIGMRRVFNQDERLSLDITYKIEPQDVMKSCPPEKISYLAVCNGRPLFRKVPHNYYSSQDRFRLEFFNSQRNTWHPIEPDVLEFYEENKYSNHELEKISNHGISLKEFYEEAKFESTNYRLVN